MKIHDVNNDGTFTCEICQARLKTMLQKHQHMTLCHKKVPGFKCVDCEFTSRSYALLSVHRKCHLPEFNKDFKYSCSQCNGKFASSQAVALHERQIHGTELKVYNCAICPHSTNNLTIHKRHKKCHNDAKDGKFKCGYCDAGFGYLMAKYNHENIHVKFLKNSKK